MREGGRGGVDDNGVVKGVTRVGGGRGSGEETHLMFGLTKLVICALTSVYGGLSVRPFVKRYFQIRENACLRLLRWNTQT